MSMKREGGGRLALVSVVAVLALRAGAAGPTPIDDAFEAMRANRVVPPVPAPDVTLPGLDGRSIRLADLRGHVVILGFFVTT